MDAAVYVAALRVERQSLIERGLPTTDVDAEIARAGGRQVETAATAPAAETAAVKRGRPRKTEE